MVHLKAGIAKYARLCDVFQRVAECYVQAKAQEGFGITSGNESSVQATSVQPALHDIDGYLSSIGFAPPPAMDGFAANDMNDADMTNYLQDWFQGNSSMMGLLEQDFTFLDQPGLGNMGYQ
jgi:hypothetical protein